MPFGLSKNLSGFLIKSQLKSSLRSGSAFNSSLLKVLIFSEIAEISEILLAHQMLG